MNMKFMTILLKEGRKEDLKKKYSSKFVGREDDLDFILNISDLQDFNHKYTDWILKNMDMESEQFDMDVDVAVQLVNDFDKYQSQLPKKDINQYNSIYELDMALVPFHEKEKDKELEKQADKIYEDDKFLVIKPKSEEASCKYGSNTRWCVTSKGSGHFGRYTAGNQELYFIINKANSTNKNYSKVAVHFDNTGFIRYWDSQDSSMEQRQIDVFEYAFPEIIESIKSDYQKTSLNRIDIYLKEVFNQIGITTSVKKNHLGAESTIEVFVEGFSTINDLGPGHAEGIAIILLNSKKIDSYQVLITYRPIDDNYFEASIGFVGKESDNEQEFLDLGLEDLEFNSKFMIQDSSSKSADSVRKYIANMTMSKIQDKSELEKLIFGDKKVWRPNRSSYGYTFKSSDKGLIKKLVDWLDKGKVGNKLDFLVDIGKLEKKTENGKSLYSQKDRNLFLPSVNWRGHFTALFSSAKLAGILDYRKVGNQYLLIKGPNFEDFKSGELKAL